MRDRKTKPCRLPRPSSSISPVHPAIPPPLTRHGSDYKYWAFISYSHQDNLLTRGDGSTDHIQWANWLHEQLETFRVPDGCRDRPTRTGEPMPGRFFPAFRDLGGQIRDVLRGSVPAPDLRINECLVSARLLILSTS
ncbi:MAG: hypothetical protein K1X78_25305 [Verrucomicrobiaceae bacterium]|nr:hypothetical protein [Verrucomicrobiaceae bacterium]